MTGCLQLKTPKSDGSVTWKGWLWHSYGEALLETKPTRRAKAPSAQHQETDNCQASTSLLALSVMEPTLVSSLQVLQLKLPLTPVSCPHNLIPLVSPPQVWLCMYLSLFYIL